MPTLETDVVWSAERLAAELTRTTSGRRRVWMLPAGADVERDAEQWLDERAYRLDERWFGLAPVKSWIQLADPPGRSAAAWLGAAGAPTLDVAQAAVALDDTPPLRTIRVIGRWRKLRRRHPRQAKAQWLPLRARPAHH